MDAYYRPRTAPAEELLGAGLPGALRKKKKEQAATTGVFGPKGGGRPSRSCLLHQSLLIISSNPRSIQWNPASARNLRQDEDVSDEGPR